MADEKELDHHFKGHCFLKLCFFDMNWWSIENNKNGLARNRNKENPSWLSDQFFRWENTFLLTNFAEVQPTINS